MIGGIGPKDGFGAGGAIVANTMSVYRSNFFDNYVSTNTGNYKWFSDNPAGNAIYGGAIFIQSVCDGKI